MRALRLVLPVVSLLACASQPRPAPVAADTAARVESRPPGLTDEEQRIVQAVDAQGEAPIALLERVVNTNSGTMNFAGVRAVGAIFAAEFERLGFTTRWVDGAGFERAGHLVAEHPGRGPKVLLVGHLDTVFEPSSPFQRFERISPRAARGPGVIDMKGGDVIIVSALQALASIGALERLNVTVVMNGDEESAGHPHRAARAALVEATRGAIAAIGFEDGTGNPRTPVINRRSAGGWTLRVHGTPAHSSQIFRDEFGYGAVFEIARVLDGFRTRLAGQAHLTFNPGLVLGGTRVELDATGTNGNGSGKSNVIAEVATATGDLRALTPEQIAATQRVMSEIVATPLRGTRSEISFDEGYPPLPPTDGNRRLLAIYDRASRDVGAGGVTAADPDRAGAADTCFLGGLVPMVIDGVGLMGDGGHTVNETADLGTLPSQTKRAALVLYRLSQTAPAATPPAARAQ